MPGVFDLGSMDYGHQGLDRGSGFFLGFMNTLQQQHEQARQRASENVLQQAYAQELDRIDQLSPDIEGLPRHMIEQMTPEDQMKLFSIYGAHQAQAELEKGVGRFVTETKDWLRIYGGGINGWVPREENVQFIQNMIQRVESGEYAVSKIEDLQALEQARDSIFSEESADATLFQNRQKSALSYRRMLEDPNIVKDLEPDTTLQIELFLQSIEDGTNPIDPKDMLPTLLEIIQSENRYGRSSKWPTRSMDGSAAEYDPPKGSFDDTIQSQLQRGYMNIDDARKAARDEGLYWDRDLGRSFHLSRDPNPDDADDFGEPDYNRPVSPDPQSRTLPFIPGQNQPFVDPNAPALPQPTGNPQGGQGGNQGGGTGQPKPKGKPRKVGGVQITPEDEKGIMSRIAAGLDSFGGNRSDSRWSQWMSGNTSTPKEVAVQRWDSFLEGVAHLVEKVNKGDVEGQDPPTRPELTAMIAQMAISLGIPEDFDRQAVLDIVRRGGTITRRKRPKDPKMVPPSKYY